jgi:hypothetical protein
MVTGLYLEAVGRTNDIRGAEIKIYNRAKTNPTAKGSDESGCTMAICTEGHRRVQPEHNTAR